MSGEDAAQPGVAAEEGASSNPFAVLPVEEPVRPVSAGSESSSRSSTSSNEVVVVEPAVHQEEEDEQEQKEEEEKTKQEEESPKEDHKTQTQPPVTGGAQQGDAIPTTPAIPTPEVITEPPTPAASKLAKAAGHATDKITSRLPGCLAKSSAFISRFNQ